MNTHKDIKDNNPKEMLQFLKNPLWKEVCTSLKQFVISGAGIEDTQTAVKMSCTMEHIHNSFPQDSPIKTNVTDKDAFRNCGSLHIADQEQMEKKILHCQSVFIQL